MLHINSPTPCIRNGIAHEQLPLGLVCRIVRNEVYSMLTIPVRIQFAMDMPILSLSARYALYLKHTETSLDNNKRLHLKNGSIINF